MQYRKGNIMFHLPNWTAAEWTAAVVAMFGLLFIVLMLCEELVERVKRLYFKIRNFNNANVL
jgi:hypothetical protein